MRGDSGVAGEGRVVGIPKFHSWGKPHSQAPWNAIICILQCSCFGTRLVSTSTNHSLCQVTE